MRHFEFEMLTLKEAAEIMGVSRNEVMKQIMTHEVKVIDVKGLYMIKRIDLFWIIKQKTYGRSLIK